MLDFKAYIYRGHKNTNWLLEPTINRLVKGKSISTLNAKSKEHLENFRFALRGRVKDSKKYLEDDNEIWAIGQHHGLATPLLDWTSSPYVAAYFAFFEKDDSDTDYRVIYSINQNSIDDFKDLEIVRPLTDENSRLINQSGLFIKVSSNEDIESLIKKKHKGFSKEFHILKVKIPNKDRAIALRSLNRMNINHNTLFPDFQGASIFCNTNLEIDKY